METESYIPDDASAMSTTPEDKYSLAAKLDSIPNQCKTAEAEDKQKEDKTTKIMITSIRTQEDKSSVESSTPDKPSVETFNELSYCQADKTVNQPLKQISEYETEYQTGITSKDIEIGGHKIEVINDTNVDEYDLDIENEEASNLAWAGEPNLKVHEHESFGDNIDSSHDQHASIEVISDTTEKQTITSQTNENTIPNLVYDHDNNREDKPVHAKTEDSFEASQDTTILKHQYSQELKTTEINLSNDTEEQENVLALYTGEKSDIEDGPLIIQEEAKEIEPATEKQLQGTTTKSEPEQEAPSTVPTLVIVEDGTIEKTIQEQTHKEEESTTIDDDKSCTQENEHEQAAKVLEAIDLLKTTSKVHAENEENADQKSEAQSSESMTLHINSDEMEKTESIQKSSYDNIEQEQSPQLPSAENQKINDGGKIIMEEAIGFPEVQTIQPPPTIESVIAETFDKSIHEEILKDAKSAVTDTKEGQTRAIEFEDKTNVLEANKFIEVNRSTCEENEQNAEPQSEASPDTITLKHPDLQRLESTEINLSNDTEEHENIPSSGTGEKSKIKDGPQIIQEEAKEIELAAETQLSVTAIESVPEEDASSIIATETLALVQSGIVEKTIQELTHEEEEPTPIYDGKSCKKNEKNVEPQSDVSLRTIALKHPDLQRLESTNINLSNDTEEEINFPPSGTGEKSEIKDCPQIIQEEAKEIEIATEKQLPVTAIESVPEDNAPSIMVAATLALVQSGTIEKTIQELPPEEEEPTPIDDEKSCTKENEHDQATKVLEAINLPETMSVEHADYKSEAQRNEGLITEHVDSEEMVKMENIEKESQDVKEVEKSPELPSAEHQEINGSGKIVPGEVLGVPEDQTLQSLPVIASTRVESADKIIQEEIHKDVELAVTDTEEGPRAEIEFEERTGVLEALDIHEVIARTSEENEEKAEQQFEANQNTTILKQPDLEGLETKKINMSNDTEETEHLQPPDLGEKLEIKDGEENLQEEAKDMEQGTKKKLPEAGIESVLEQETLPTMPKLVTVEGGTAEKTIQEQTHEEDEPTPIDDDRSFTTENEHEKETKAIEAIDLPETMSKVSAEKEENSDQKSKEQSSDGEKWITSHIDLEEIVTTESIEKSGYDVKELKKTLELHSAENQDIDDGGKIMLEEGIGVPDGQTLQPLPPLASIGVQNVDRSIQEGMHIDGESTVTDTEEAIELHEVIANTTKENEKKVAPQYAASLETIVSKDPNLERLDKTAIKQSNDTEEQENVPESNTGEKLEIKDSPKIIQEEAREKELATEIQLPETVTESVHEQEAPSTATPPEIVESGIVEETIQEKIHEEDQPKLIDDDRSCSSENEHEQASNILEAIGLPGTMSKGSAENEELANKKSEAQTGENVITMHINLEETGTIENIEKSSYVVKDLEKTPELPSAENREITGRGKIVQEEAIGVPEDQTLQPPTTVESVIVQTVDKSIQEEIHTDGKSAMTDIEEEQRHENEFEGKTNVLEAYDLHKVIASTTEEHEKKAKHLNLEELGTMELNQGNHTEELENFQASDTVEQSSIKDSSRIIQEEAKEMELATEKQLLEMATKSVSEQDAPSTMPILTTAQSGKVEKAIYKHTHEEEESTQIDDNMSFTQDNEHEQVTKCLQEIDQPEAMSKASADNEQHADKKSEAQSIENVNTKHIDSEEVGKMASIEKSSHDVKELNETTELPSVENLEIKEGVKNHTGGSNRCALGSNPAIPTIASIGVETVNNSIQEKVQNNGKSALSDTEEEQKQENKFEDKTNVLQAFKMDELIATTCEENDMKAEPQSEASIDPIVLKHPDLEVLDTTEISLSNQTEEQENVMASDTGKILEAKDGPQIIQDEAKEMELATENQLPESSTETIVEGGTVEKTSQEQTYEEEESKLIDDDKSCSPENEYEQETKVVEAINVPKTTSKANAENEENANQKSEEQSRENLIAKHVDSEEMVTLENIEKSSYDVKEIKITPELPPAESQEINACGNILLEEAVGVPEDQALQPLPTTESGIDETLDKSTEEKLHRDGESTMTDTEEGVTHENESVENVLEELDSHEVIAIRNKEIEKKVESQSESILNTTALKHTSLEGLETIEINPGIENEEPENVRVSDTGKKLEMKDGAKIIQEEESVMELATGNQLLEAPTASVNEQEDPSTRATPVIVEGGMLEKLTQEQTHEEEESTQIDDNKSNTPENKHEQESIVLEEIDLPKTMSTFSAENEEHANHKSEAQCSNVIAKHTDPEEMVATECIEKSTYDVKLLDKTQELPSSENRDINDSEKIMPQEAIGVPDNQSLQSPPTIACSGVETVDKNIQKETHKDNESAVTEAEEEHLQENEYEGKTNVLEVFDLPEVIASTSKENVEKSEPELEVSLDTIVLKHLTDPNLEGLETTEINKSIDTGKPENVSASNTGEKLEIKDGSEIIKDKSKEMELATDKMLPETTTKSVPEQEALSTMPTTAIPEGGMLEKIIQEQTNEKEESTLEDDDKCYTIKNEHENETEVLEVIGLPETMNKVSAENEEHADQKSESQSSVNTISKHIDSEEAITTDIPSVIHQVINVGGKITPKEAIGVPKDQTLQPLPTIAYVGVETIDKSIQEEIHKDDESAVTSGREEKAHENKFEDKMKVLEGFGLHEIIASTSEENENNAEPQTEASLNSNVIKIHDSEGLETIEINSSNDTEEPENVLASDKGEKLEIKDGAKIILVEAKEMELATEQQLKETETESILEDEAQTVLPTSEFVKGETTEKSFQGETLKEEQSTAIDKDNSCRPENEHEQTTEVLEHGECIRVGNFQAEAQRETSIPGTNLVFLNQIEDVDLVDARKFEGRENSTTPNEDFSFSTTTDASEEPQKDEGKNTLYRSFSLIPQEVEKEDKAESFNRVDFENIFEKSEARTNENIEEQTTDYENSLVVSLPIEGIVNQVKDHDVENFKATDSIEQRDIMDLSFENDPARKEAAPRDSDKAIESEAIGKLEIQELETDQIGSAKGSEGEDEFEKISPSSNDNIMIKDSQDSDVKVSTKKHHGILSGVGSKVKHSISKVKKAITGKSSHSKASTEK